MAATDAKQAAAPQPSTSSLVVAVETLRDVILERKASSKDTVLAVHRMNQVLAKASSYAQAEQVLASCLGPSAGASKGKKGHVSPLIEVLVQLVVTGKPETYPVLCLLHTFALFEGPSGQLKRLQIPLILQAMLKGKLEDVTADMAKRILHAMEKHEGAMLGKS